ALRGGRGLLLRGRRLRLRRRNRLLRRRGALGRRRLALGPGEDALEPGDRVVLGEVLRVHELRGEDLLRLDVHLLLAGRESLLAQNLALLALHDRACPVVRIHDLVADSVQADSLCPSVVAKSAGGLLGYRRTETAYQNPWKSATFAGISLLRRTSRPVRR